MTLVQLWTISICNFNLIVYYLCLIQRMQNAECCRFAHGMLICFPLNSTSLFMVCTCMSLARALSVAWASFSLIPPSNRYFCCNKSKKKSKLHLSHKSHYDVSSSGILELGSHSDSSKWCKLEETDQEHYDFLLGKLFNSYHPFWTQYNVSDWQFSHFREGWISLVYLLTVQSMSLKSSETYLL